MFLAIIPQQQSNINLILLLEVQLPVQKL